MQGWVASARPPTNKNPGYAGGSAVRVQVSHAHTNIVMTRVRIGLILCFILIFLSFQVVFSLASATTLFEQLW